MSAAAWFHWQHFAIVLKLSIDNATLLIAGDPLPGTATAPEASDQRKQVPKVTISSGWRRA